MLRIVIAVVLLAHGVGHILGPLQVFKVATVNPAWQGDSWLLSGTFGSSSAPVVGVALWTVAMAGFIALAGVVLGWLPQSWWPALAIGSSVASLSGLILFPLAFPTTGTIGAFVVDVAVLAAVLWFHWVPSDLTA